MIDSAQKRGELIRHLEDTLALADEIQDGQTGFLISRSSVRSMKRAHGNLDRSGELSLVIKSCGRCGGVGGSCAHRRKLLYHENIERMLGSWFITAAIKPS
jgi:hypothetical protein